MRRGLATIAVMEEDQNRQTRSPVRVADVNATRRCGSTRSICGGVRSIGLFGIVALVRNQKTKEPMATFNGTSPEMAAHEKFFLEEGLYTFVRLNYFFINPPLSMREQELREGFAIIDRGQTVTDQAVA